MRRRRSMARRHMSGGGFRRSFSARKARHRESGWEASNLLESGSYGELAVSGAGTEHPLVYDSRMEEGLSVAGRRRHGAIFAALMLLVSAKVAWLLLFPGAAVNSVVVLPLLLMVLMSQAIVLAFRHRRPELTGEANAPEGGLCDHESAGGCPKGLYLYAQPFLYPTETDGVRSVETESIEGTSVGIRGESGGEGRCCERDLAATPNKTRSPSTFVSSRIKTNRLAE